MKPKLLDIDGTPTTLTLVATIYYETRGHPYCFKAQILETPDDAYLYRVLILDGRDEGLVWDVVHAPYQKMLAPSAAAGEALREMEARDEVMRKYFAQNDREVEEAMNA